MRNGAVGVTERSAAAVGAALAFLGTACGPAAPPRVTYFHPTYAISFEHPHRWTPEYAGEDDARYLYFRSPPTSKSTTGAVTVTVIAQPLGEQQSLADFALLYATDQQELHRLAAQRLSATGFDVTYAATDSSTKSRLFLLEEHHHVFGLHIHGEPSRFDELADAIETMTTTFTLQRPGQYPEIQDATFRYSLRIPPSWRETRGFARGPQRFLQFTSPAIAVDKQGHTVHATLTLSVEPLPKDASEGALDAYYRVTRERFGDAYPVLSHDEWAGGYVDVMRSESAMSVSRVRRFYFAADGRGYSLSCEAREDVQQRVFPWCDMIATTLRVGPDAER